MLSLVQIVCWALCGRKYLKNIGKQFTGRVHVRDGLDESVAVFAHTFNLVAKLKTMSLFSEETNSCATVTVKWPTEHTRKIR